MELSPHLFWDIDASQLDYEKNARFIIERVVTTGRLSDWDAIRDYYGVEKIRKEVIQIRYLDDITLHFLSAILHIPIENFRCYTLRSSMTPHSSF